jgi:REP element-mobilizing transposase RayT
MPRRPRLFVAGGFYHVTLRGNHQRTVFLDESDRGRLDAIVAASLDACAARLHAYCWMSNHLHFLIEISDRPLGGVMQRIGARFARAVHKRIPATGHLFQNRYYAQLVDRDEYFLQVLRYIHLNPVEAGLVPSARDWPWSSHADYLGVRASGWVTTELALGLLHGDRARARRRYERFIADGRTRVARSPANSASGAPEPCAAASARAPLADGADAATSIRDLADRICARHQVSLRELLSRSRKPALTKIRDVLALRAVADGIATPREVARFLGRSEAAVSRAIARGAARRESQVDPSAAEGTCAIRKA